MPKKLGGISNEEWELASAEARKYFSSDELTYIKGYITGILSLGEVPTIDKFLPPLKFVRVGTAAFMPWQIHHLAQGKCVRCDFKRYYPARTCKYHLNEIRRYYRDKLGYRPWRPTSPRGNPPVEVARKYMTKAEIAEGLKTETAFWKQEWEKIVREREERLAARRQAAFARKLVRLKRGRPNNKIPPVPGVSRQRAWQIYQISKGRCMYCAKPRAKVSKHFCVEHLMESRRRSRDRARSKAVERQLLSIINEIRK